MVLLAQSSPFALTLSACLSVSLSLARQERSRSCRACRARTEQQEGRQQEGQAPRR